MFKDIKVIYMGTPDISVPALNMLIKETNVLLVVTQPDKYVGRKKVLEHSPVKKIAIENNIEVHQPIRIRKDFDIIKELKPDLIVTCAYGQIVSKEILDIPRLGCVNIHGSILPKLRGAAPIEWSILNGDKTTGITLMYMDEGIDTGDMFSFSEIDINDSDNKETLYEKLGVVGSNLLKDNLSDIVNNKTNRIKQDNEKHTYARMLTREDEYIDLSNDGKACLNKIRGLYPNAYILINNIELKVLNASFIKKDNVTPNKIIEVNKNNFILGVNDGLLSLEVVKPSGKNIMNIKNYLNGIDKEKIMDSKVGKQ